MVEPMIRCQSCNRLIPRYPCQQCKPHTRNKQVARAVILRDKQCVHCGTTERLEAGHKRGYEKRLTGQDDPRFMEAQCFSYNRTGRCKR